METKTSQVDKTENSRLQDLYLKTSHLLTDFDFMEDELRFFKKVINQYLSKTNAALNRQVEQVKNQIYQLEMDKQLLRDEVLTQLNVLDLTLKGLTRDAEGKLDEIETGIQGKEQGLFEKFRSFKHDLFEVTEKVIANDKNEREIG